MGIRHNVIRLSSDKLDIKFIQLINELETAYYKNWRQGESHAFYGFDVRPSKAVNKKQFDLLHGIIWHFHVIMFHKLNVAYGFPVDQDSYRYAVADADNDGTLGAQRDRVAESRMWIKEQVQTYSINITPVKNRLETLFNRLITL